MNHNEPMPDGKRRKKFSSENRVLTRDELRNIYICLIMIFVVQLVMGWVFGRLILKLAEGYADQQEDISRIMRKVYQPRKYYE